MKKKILLLATGGTIASLLSDHGLRPGLNAEQILSFVPEIKEECDVDAVQVCNIDSTNMSPAVWKQMVCAIGLGNVWRFPWVVGKNGGAFFVLLYLVFLALLGLPVLIS